ncbi:AAA family ATPase [Flavobacterium sp.]|uniref:ATP-dependent nuclease n=1 Tax=Flavobacterium sp. TaxID=239 RepID=UPI00260B3CAD|nr:AAA family ATPase [Flavobacterium sp.]
MKITQITIKKFRLLEKIKLNIEDDITLIVGKNNTGKTSLFEVINMFLNENSSFTFHDFSQSTYPEFENCFELFNDIGNEDDEEKKESLEKVLIDSMPRIELEIVFEYNKATDSLIHISDFISDLDDDLHVATVRLSYESKESNLLFKSFIGRKDPEQKLSSWLNENISKYYLIRCYGGENLIEENFKRRILSVVNFETIQASRKLDDTKTDKNKTLAVGFSDYYRETNKENNEDVEQLEVKLKETSDELNIKYEAILKELLVKLKLFGVDPHLTIPEIILKSGFDAESILRNNIKYFYKQEDIELPENFNGLGYSNLIYLVLKVISFIEKYKKADILYKSEILTILIEEPEAHLHPQMQQVFIAQIKRTIQDAKKNDGLSVQVIISTHSSHIVTEAGIDVDRSFERIRYFTKSYNEATKRFEVGVKDFNEFKHQENDEATFRFLKQYMSLHRCDIFFADKVILVEGTTERMLLPLMINKVAAGLNNEYISLIEVGGAYTVKFKELLKFINAKTLVITDIDSVDPANNRTACATNTLNAQTSNSTLIHWLPKKSLISEIIACDVKDKFDGNFIRVAYQSNEDGSDYVARSLEEAIINKNVAFFKSTYKSEMDDTDLNVKDSFVLLTGKDLNSTPYDLAPNSKEKTNFTFDLMVFNETKSGLLWSVPNYIKEGLEWLANNNPSND